MKLLERIYLHIVPPEIKHIYNAILEKDDTWKKPDYGAGAYKNNTLAFTFNDASYFCIIIIKSEMCPFNQIRVQTKWMPILYPSNYLLTKACNRRKHMIDFDKIKVI